MAIEIYNILNRFTGEVQCSVEIDVSANELPSIKLGLAVKAAIKENKNLIGANLIGANLSDANLSYAILRGANLSYAILSGANLRGANLSYAILDYAILRGANLSDANLSDAILSGANLIGAHLSGAILSGANLIGAHLSGAHLSGANLRGANLRDGFTITKPPIQILGIKRAVIIFDNAMKIGCQIHSLYDWKRASDKQIAAWGCDDDIEPWNKFKKLIFAIAKADGRDFSKVKEAA